MRAWFDHEELDRWENKLASQYEAETRTGLHVSDLIVCLRRPVLLEEYFPEWDINKLYMFTFGRGWEKEVFKDLLPEATQELEVTQKIDGVNQVLEGHIDFGADPLDYECKATWSKLPTTDDEVEELFSKNWYWEEQAGAYAVMRRRTACRFAVLHIPTFPNPTLRIYRVEWTKQELAEIWRAFTQRARYVQEKRARGELPARTQHKWACKGCPVEEVCPSE